MGVNSLVEHGISWRVASVALAALLVIAMGWAWKALANDVDANATKLDSLPSQESVQLALEQRANQLALDQVSQIGEVKSDIQEIKGAVIRLEQAQDRMSRQLGELTKDYALLVKEVQRLSLQP